jgi:hypothetical protein
LTSEGLKDAAREVGETFSSALTGEEANAVQASNRPRAAEEAGPRTQARPAQAGPGTHSNKGNRPTRGSTGATSSGDRR